MKSRRFIFISFAAGWVAACITQDAVLKRNDISAIGGSSRVVHDPIAFLNVKARAQKPPPTNSVKPANGPSKPASPPPKPANTPPKSASPSPTPKPANTPPKPANTPPKPANTPPKPANTPPKPANTPPKSASPSPTPKPANTPPKPANTPPKPANTPPKPANTPPKPANTPPKPANTPPKPASPSPKPSSPPDPKKGKIVFKPIDCNTVKPYDGGEPRVRSRYLNNETWYEIQEKEHISIIQKRETKIGKFAGQPTKSRDYPQASAQLARNPRTPIYHAGLPRDECAVFDLSVSTNGLGSAFGYTATGGKRRVISEHVMEFQDIESWGESLTKDQKSTIDVMWPAAGQVDLPAKLKKDLGYPDNFPRDNPQNWLVHALPLTVAHADEMPILEEPINIRKEQIWKTPSKGLKTALLDTKKFNKRLAGVNRRKTAAEAAEQGRDWEEYKFGALKAIKYVIQAVEFMKVPTVQKAMRDQATRLAFIVDALETTVLPAATQTSKVPYKAVGLKNSWVAWRRQTGDLGVERVKEFATTWQETLKRVEAEEQSDHDRFKVNKVEYERDDPFGFKYREGFIKDVQKTIVELRKLQTAFKNPWAAGLWDPNTLPRP